MNKLIPHPEQETAIEHILKCLEKDCTAAYKGRGYCGKHYQRAFRAGTIRPLPKQLLFERFWAKVDKTSSDKGCWLWTGATTALGYGVAKGIGKNAPAHRLSWCWANYCPMPPPRLKIDHTCHNPPCVNPEHLRLVTHKQNMEHRAGATVRSKSEVRGVSPSRGKWRATLGHDKKHYSAGYFNSIEEAAIAVQELRNKVFTHNDMDK